VRDELAVVRGPFGGGLGEALGGDVKLGGIVALGDALFDGAEGGVASDFFRIGGVDGDAGLTLRWARTFLFFAGGGRFALVVWRWWGLICAVAEVSF
jgi:hypothetical protein